MKSLRNGARHIWRDDTCRVVVRRNIDGVALAASGFDPHQGLLAFHNLDRQLEINQPRL